MNQNFPLPFEERLFRLAHCLERGHCDVCGGGLYVQPRFREDAQTYVVQRQGYVKIGRSKHPETRLKELRAINRQRYIVTPPQMDTSEPLLLLFVLPGDTEHELHMRFAAAHVLGEWFLPDVAMRDWMRRCT